MATDPIKLKNGRAPGKAKRSRRPTPRRDGLRTLVVGAGEAGCTIVQGLRRMPEFGLTPVGFLDDDATLQTVRGLPVLGRIDALNAVSRAHSIAVVIVAIPSLPPREVRAIAQQASAAGVSVRYLPSFVAALERDARIEDLRRLRVDELLGRREVHVVSPQGRAVVTGKRVLVTGAGGSIGGELCRQIRSFAPESLHLLDHDETNLHRVQLALDGHGLLDDGAFLVADIRDQGRIRQIFQQVQPEIVFHAAAHKHLPLLERHPCEGVKSNVLGTHHLVRAALETQVERFILISTDKAADPTSILGATKRLAEMILHAYSGGPTLFASVRFGNVLGSRGSFLSVVAEQIENGEPVTVTHPDVTRFFMTIEEAVGLVIEAAHMADHGKVFVLDMGEPVRIVDLVRKYAAQVHVDEDQLVIRYTGLRSGEKLDEALFSRHEQRVVTEHARIWATGPEPVNEDTMQRLEELYAAAARNDSSETKRVLESILPGYSPVAREPQPSTVAAPYPDWF